MRDGSTYRAARRNAVLRPRGEDNKKDVWLGHACRVEIVSRKVVIEKLPAPRYVPHQAKVSPYIKLVTGADGKPQLIKVFRKQPKTYPYRSPRRAAA